MGDYIVFNEVLKHFVAYQSFKYFPQISSNDRGDYFFKISYHPFYAPELNSLLSILRATYHFQDRI